MSDTIACPDPTCQAPARIVDRWTFGSTSGGVEHVKTMCDRGHWFTPLAEMVEQKRPVAVERGLEALPA